MPTTTLPDPSETPFVPADVLGDLIPTTPLLRPAVPADADPKTLAAAADVDSAVAGVITLREDARKAAADAATLTVVGLITGGADRAIGTVVAALEAEERVRVRIAEFAPVAAEAARAALDAAIADEQKARESIAAKLERLGYHGDRARYAAPGYVLYWPALIASHPGVKAAQARQAEFRAMPTRRPPGRTPTP